MNMGLRDRGNMVKSRFVFLCFFSYPTMYRWSWVHTALVDGELKTTVSLKPPICSLICKLTYCPY